MGPKYGTVFFMAYWSFERSNCPKHIEKEGGVRFEVEHCQVTFYQKIRKTVNNIRSMRHTLLVLIQYLAVGEVGK